jgi:hypothetical protein
MPSPFQRMWEKTRAFRSSRFRLRSRCLGGDAHRAHVGLCSPTEPWHDDGRDGAARTQGIAQKPSKHWPVRVGTGGSGLSVLLIDGCAVSRGELNHGAPLGCEGEFAFGLFSGAHAEITHPAGAPLTTRHGSTPSGQACWRARSRTTARDGEGSDCVPTARRPAKGRSRRRARP